MSTVSTCAKYINIKVSHAAKFVTVDLQTILHTRVHDLSSQRISRTQIQWFIRYRHETERLHIKTTTTALPHVAHF